MKIMITHLRHLYMQHINVNFIVLLNLISFVIIDLKANIAVHNIVKMSIFVYWTTLFGNKRTYFQCQKQHQVNVFYNLFILTCANQLSFLHSPTLQWVFMWQEFSNLSLADVISRRKDLEKFKIRMKIYWSTLFVSILFAKTHCRHTIDNNPYTHKYTSMTIYVLISQFSSLTTK